MTDLQPFSETAIEVYILFRETIPIPENYTPTPDLEELDEIAQRPLNLNLIPKDKETMISSLRELKFDVKEIGQIMMQNYRSAGSPKTFSNESRIKQNVDFNKWSALQNNILDLVVAHLCLKRARTGESLKMIGQQNQRLNGIPDTNYQQLPLENRHILQRNIFARHS